MILDKIVEDKILRLKEQKKNISLPEMQELALASTRVSDSFYNALAKDGLSIIGEFKKASPSMGVLPKTIDVAQRIEQYSRSVDAISCLTEEDHFSGNIEDFKQIRAITDLPMIRKDFIIDEYQIYEAKIIGADAILLIAAILSDEQMRVFYELACKLGMDALVEVHDEQEMQRAIELNSRIIGVNNRNLKDFSISLQTTKNLGMMLPEGKVFVSESGITKDEDIEFLKECNVDALLIGRALMEVKEPKLVADKWKSIYQS